MWVFVILGLCFVISMLIFVRHVILLELDMDTWSVQFYIHVFLFKRICILNTSVYKIIAKAIKAQKKKKKRENKRSAPVGLINRLSMRIKLRIVIPSKSIDMTVSALLASVFYIMETHNKISANKIIPHYVYTFDTFSVDGIISIRIWDIMKASTRYVMKRIRRGYAQ